MKKQLFVMMLIFGATQLKSQNIGMGTASPAAKLHVKGSADVSQLIVEANSTQSNANPLINLRKSDGTTLMWINSDNFSNIFIGQNAGRVNNYTNGGNTNIFIGNDAGYSNTIGKKNTAIGSLAMKNNTGGDDNVAIGINALFNNITGLFNTAIGSGALSSNTAGGENTAVGYSALAFNKNHYNTGIGNGALFNTDLSQYNVALGYHAGYLYHHGYNNVFLGANTNTNADGLYNVIAIGQGTVCTAISQVTIGNGATTTYRAYAGWSNISDGRYKKDIREDVPGLAFINKLRPVTYTLDATGLEAFLHKDIPLETQINEQAQESMTKALIEKEQIRVTGFVAQEVERSAKELGFDFSGVDAPKNKNDVYGLRYSEFVVPLVKAIQEQQQQVDYMQKEIELLKEQNKMLMQLLISKKQENGEIAH